MFEDSGGPIVGIFGRCGRKTREKTMISRSVARAVGHRGLRAESDNRRGKADINWDRAHIQCHRQPVRVGIGFKQLFSPPSAVVSTGSFAVL